MNRYSGLLLGTAAALVLLTGPASADNANERWFRYSIVGTWQVVVTVRVDTPDCTTAPLVTFPPNPFPALHTYHSDGTVSETGSRSPPSRRSPGHGFWESSGRNNYVARVLFQSFDAVGNLSSNMDMRHKITLARDGKTFTAVSRFRNTDISGNALLFCATMEGARVTL